MIFGRISLMVFRGGIERCEVCASVFCTLSAVFDFPLAVSESQLWGHYSTYFTVGQFPGVHFENLSRELSECGRR